MSPFPDLTYVKSFLNAWDVLYCFLEVNCSTMKESVLAQIESRCCKELSKAAGLKVFDACMTVKLIMISPFLFVLCILCILYRN